MTKVWERQYNTIIIINTINIISKLTVSTNLYLGFLMSTDNLQNGFLSKEKQLFLNHKKMLKLYWKDNSLIGVCIKRHWMIRSIEFRHVFHIIKKLYWELLISYASFQEDMKNITLVLIISRNQIQELKTCLEGVCIFCFSCKVLQ